MKRFRIRKIIGFILLGIMGLFIFSAVVMLLWNNLLTSLFHWRLITLWEAMGLLVLCKLLFGGFRGGGWGHHPSWRNRMNQKWMNMTPEEKEKFKQEWKNRCGRSFEEEKPQQ